MSALRKKPVNQVCPHCSRKIKWAWIIRYESFGLVRLVYLCSHCEQVLKTEDERKSPHSFPVSGTTLMRLV